MGEQFELDLRHAEEQIEDLDEEFEGSVVLGVLDGTTPPEEWVDEVLGGKVLLLSVEGELNELAAPFAADVKDAGGTLMHFREFLVVAPPGVGVDAGRLTE